MIEYEIRLCLIESIKRFFLFILWFQKSIFKQSEIVDVDMVVVVVVANVVVVVAKSQHETNFYTKKKSS